MQCEGHTAFLEVALGHGWTLWNYGTDNECTEGGKNIQYLTSIWMKPCAWDDTQMIPVGCLCCTDLNLALWNYSYEVDDVIKSRLIRMGKLPMPDVHSGFEIEPLAQPPSWLRPYRAR